MNGAPFRLLILAALLGGAFACQSEECANYVRCQNAFDDRLNVTPYDTERFEPGGDCWDHKGSSERCTAQCVQQQNQLREVAADANEVIEECPQADAPNDE